jgi:superfamily II DNA or RNA helicase
MALTTHLYGYVSRAVQGRGYSYYRIGAVRIINGNKDELQAFVFGSNRYKVNLYRKEDTLYASCTCPYFEGEGETCKHIWATLLAGEKSGYLRGKDKSDPLRLKVDLEGDDWDENEEGDWDGVEELEDGNPVWPGGAAGSYSPRLQGRRHLRLVPPSSGWKNHLTSLRGALQVKREEEKKRWPATQRILYFVDGPATLEGKGLVIEVSHQEMKKNGEWGQLKSHTNAYCTPENLRDPEDQHIMALLLGSRDANSYYYGYTGYYGRGPFRRFLPGPMQEHLMKLLCHTGRCFLRQTLSNSAESPLQWDDGGAWEFCLSPEKNASGRAYVLKGYLQRGANRVPVEEPPLLVAGGLVFFESKVSPFLDNGSFGWISALRKRKSLTVPFEEGDTFIRELMAMPVLPRLSLPEELQYEEIQVTPRPRLTVVAAGRKNQWEANLLHWKLSFDYQGHIIAYEDPGRGFLIAEPRRFMLRDFDAEHSAYEKVRSLGFREIRSYYGDLRREVAPRNLPGAVRELLPAGWHVEAEGKVYRLPGAFNLSVTTGIDWFELHGEFRFDDKVAKLPELLSALKRGDNVVPLDDGTFGMLPEEWLKKYGSLVGLGTTHNGHFRFTRCQVGLLDALLVSQPESTCDDLFKRCRAELMSFEGVQPCDPPEQFAGTLRGYQKDGLGWIHFLEKFSFGGCLADDMGLGKTVQVLAMLEERRQKQSATLCEARDGKGPIPRNGVPGPCLVVAPKSIVFNWIQEAKRFTPQLKVLDHTGANRLKPGEHFENYDLILTTYGTLRKDAVEFKDVQFDYCILDEGQAIKNANTQSAKAVRLINANHRLVLSGTPIENHLGELWSLFEFLNPGMLGSATVFKLTGAGARNPEPETRALLGKALRPFILRRTKAQVARELPEKMEQTLYCDLDSKQRKLYNELRDHYRRALINQVERDGINKCKIQILEALLRLRQAACHPGLIDRAKKSLPSAKLEMLLPQLEQITEEEHKVLVFSQFTSFLAILREQLDKQKTPYAYLDGQTRKRGTVVEQFQTDPDCKLFLISLKAGGLGLNLTAAEYVYLLDPWWNPAVEAQAIDRTHRIGQTRKVFAYRIIARDTVEEKVLELQRTKRDLADAIINADNSIIRNLAKEDLELLLS